MVPECKQSKCYKKAKGFNDVSNVRAHFLRCVKKNDDWHQGMFNYTYT